MELGNLAFGNARGEFSFPSEFENALVFLIEETGEEISHPEFENDTFVLRPYYWGDCACGFVDLAWEWKENNPHSEDCYQFRLDNYEKKLKDWFYRNHGVAYFDNDKGEWVGDPTSRNGIAGSKVWEKEKAAKERMYKKICEEYGIPYNNGFGCAVHCTCGRKERWIEWIKEHGHSEDCPIVLDNFHHKPTEFGVQWYKYPFRDTYMNMDIDKNQFRKIIYDCLESLNVQEERSDAKK